MAACDDSINKILQNATSNKGYGIFIGQFYKEKPQILIAMNSILPDDNIMWYQWLYHHCIEVRKLLPGGLDIIGIFECTGKPNEDLDFKKLIRLLFQTAKGKEVFCSTSFVVFKQNSFCIIKRNSENPRQPGEMKEINVKYISNYFSNQLHIFNSCFMIDFSIPFPLNFQNLEKSILDNWDNYVSNLAYASFNDNIAIKCQNDLNDSNILVEKLTDQINNIDFFIDSKCNSNDGIIQDNIRFSGKVMAYSYIISKQSLKYALRETLNNIRKIIKTRLDILYESIEFKYGDKLSMPEIISKKGIFMPRQVLIKLPELNLTVYDYLLDSEKDDIIGSHVHTLFSSQNFNIEHIEPIDIPKNITDKNSKKNVHYPIISYLILFLAFIIALLISVDIF